MDDLERKVRFFVPLHHVRQDLAFGKLAHTLAQVLLLVVELEVQGDRPVWDARSELRILRHRGTQPARVPSGIAVSGTESAGVMPSAKPRSNNMPSLVTPRISRGSR